MKPVNIDILAMELEQRLPYWLSSQARYPQRWAVLRTKAHERLLARARRGKQASDAFVESEHPRGGRGTEKGGQFVSKGGGSGGKAATVKLVKIDRRAFEGRPVEVSNGLSKQETGRIGEGVALEFARSVLGHVDAKVFSLKNGEKATDMIGDHILMEIKAGLVSNGPKAQQWRATEGEPGKAEKEWRQQATPDEIAALGRQRQQAILERKYKMLARISKQVGRAVEPKTVTMIINPDTATADVYLFDGYHRRVGWNSDQAKAAYHGSYRYED